MSTKVKKGMRPWTGERSGPFVHFTTGRIAAIFSPFLFLLSFFFWGSRRSTSPRLLSSARSLVSSLLVFIYPLASSLASCTRTHTRTRTPSIAYCNLQLSEHEPKHEQYNHNHDRIRESQPESQRSTAYSLFSAPLAKGDVTHRRILERYAESHPFARFGSRNHGSAPYVYHDALQPTIKGSRAREG